MGIITYQQQLPAPKTPVINQSGQNATADFRYLWLSLLNRTGGNDGVPSIDSGAVASVGVAYPITKDWTQFVAVAAGSIAQLPAMKPGSDAVIFNDGANAIAVDPPAGLTIDGGASYSIPSGKMQWLRCITPTLIKSMQLG